MTRDHSMRILTGTTTKTKQRATKEFTLHRYASASIDKIVAMIAMQVQTTQIAAECQHRVAQSNGEKEERKKPKEDRNYQHKATIVIVFVRLRLFPSCRP